MSWNPVEARKILDSHPDINFIRAVKKLSGFEMESGRQLALSEENKTKVTIYMKRAPFYLEGVEVEETYARSPKREGRHADLEALTNTLGYSRKAYRVHVKNEAAFIKLLHWYQYA